MAPFKQIAAIVLSGALMFATAGCGFLVGAAVGAGVGIGAYSYANNSLDSNWAQDVTTLADATKAAFKDLGITETSASVSPSHAKIVGTGFSDDTVTVEITKSGDHTSSIQITIGTFGDKDKSLQVYNAIKSHV